MQVALGEGCFGIEIGLDVGPAALDEKLGQATAVCLMRRPRQIFRQPLQRLIQQTDQRPEGPFVAAVGSSGDEDQMPGGNCGQCGEQFIPLMPATPSREIAGAGLGLIHNHQFRAGAQEFSPVAIALDEVDRHHSMVVELENRLVGSTLPLQSGDGAGEHQLRVDMKLVGQFPLPLFGQMRRTEHHPPTGLPASQEFSSDQAGLNRFADTDVIGNQHPCLWLLEGHEQRHQLIGTGLDGN